MTFIATSMKEHNGQRLWYPVVALVLFAVSFSLLVATIPDYGLTWDEPYYIENARSIERWFTGLGNSPDSLKYEVVNAHWKSELGEDLSGNVHPPFYKISAIAFRHLLGRYLFDNIVFQYRVSTAFWTAIAVVALFFVSHIMTRSLLWACLTGGIFLAVPRFFAEGHIFATDMTISALGFTGLALFFFGIRPGVRIVLAGVLFGAALATKFTGVLAVGLCLPLILLQDDRMARLRDFLLMGLVALVCFALFNFPFLLRPAAELKFYLGNFLQRQQVIPISTLYFGKSYNFDLPVYQPWVMLGITLPPMLLVGAVIGMTTSMGKLRTTAAFYIIPIALLMAVYMFPFVPKHDGIRLFSSIWPFLVLASTMGYYRLGQLGKPWLGVAFCVVTIISTFVASYRIHPYQLSYYNTFIGGTAGAQEQGFSIAYWYDAFNRKFFTDLALSMGDDPRPIFSYPDSDIVFHNQQYGFFPKNNASVKWGEPFGYLLVLNRIVPPEISDSVQRCEPVLELKTYDGAFIGGMYRVPVKR